MHIGITETISYIRNHRGGQNIYIVGIDGPGAGGKSYMADKIAAEFADAQIVHFDDFYLNYPEPGDKSIVGYRFDWERLLKQVLLPLRNNQQAHYQEYDWELQQLGKWKSVIPNGIIVIEGVYSIRNEVRPWYDLTVFVYANYKERLKRGIDRDGIAARNKWVEEWMPEEIRYMKSEHHPKDNADIVIGAE